MTKSNSAHTSAQPSRFGRLLPDAVAGITVALVAIPQSMAYAELAGIPAHYGLYAVALPPLFAAIFASSAWLQTGPVATTSLLTLGALASVTTLGASNYVSLAALLAVIVGVFRILIGLVRGGSISYLMNHAVLRGFILAAAVLIFLSQLPAVVGISATSATVLGRAAQVFSLASEWRLDALGFSALTLTLIYGGRRLHPMFPGVLLAALISIALSLSVGYDGPTLGHVPAGLPHVHLDLPWHRTVDLLLPGAIIALVGFAEATSIAQTFAEREGVSWDPNREFISQGVANLTAGLSGGFPVGGSFSRSALGHLAGGKTRLAGAITGLAVLAILPFAALLEPLPKAVLGATVIAAVGSLIRLDPLREIWHASRPQWCIALLTFSLTLVFAPRVELAVLAGVGVSLAVHLGSQSRPQLHRVHLADSLTLSPQGMLWFGAAPHLRQQMTTALEAALSAQKTGLSTQKTALKSLKINLSGLGGVDMSGAMMLAKFVSTARHRGLTVDFEAIPLHAQTILSRVCDTPPQEQ